MRLDVFSQKKLHEALTEGGFDVSLRTVRRWIEGEATPNEAWKRAILEVLDTHKEAAPSEEGAAETLLRLWQGDQPPAWSNIQVTKVIEEIRRDRAAAMTAMARRLGRMTAAELQELLSQLPDGSTPTASDQ